MRYFDINVSYGDIIYFSEKPANIKWKISLFSSNSMSSNTLVYRGPFSDQENMHNYIIDNEDLMQCTDKMTAFYCNGIGSDFTFYDRDRENKLFVYADTITQMIINMQSIAEKHTKQYTDDNVVRFKVTRKISHTADKDFIEHTKFFNNWMFAV